MILTFFIAFILIFVEVSVNWWIIEKKKKSPNHKRRSQYRSITTLIFIILSTQWAPEVAWNFWKLFFEVLMLEFTFWWTFDTFLSLFRGRGWYELDGEDPEEDAIVDNFEEQYGGAHLWFWAKLTLAITFSILFIIV